jgi:Leucine-rich repeat (LRR) protein
MQWGGPDSFPDYSEEETEKKRSPFAALPDTAAKLVSLKFLNLSNTEVTLLPDYLGGLPALERLDIVSCNIKTIPPSLRRLADNGELTLLKTGKEYNAHSWSGERKKPRRKA